MSNKQITDQSALASLDTGDLFIVRDVSANVDKKATREVVATGVAAALPNNSVAAAALATTAITLGYAQITATTSANNSSTHIAAGISSTVTIPAGSRNIFIMAYAPLLYNGTVNGQSAISIWDGTVGSGTQLSTGYAANSGNAGSSGSGSCTAYAVVTPSAGSKTYNVGYAITTGSNAQIYAASTAPAFILVAAI